MSPPPLRLSSRISSHLLRNLRYNNIINRFSTTTTCASINLPSSSSSSIPRQLSFPSCQVTEAPRPKETTSTVVAQKAAVPNSSSSPWTVIDFDETTKLLFFVDADSQLYYPVRTPHDQLSSDAVTRCFGSCFGWLIMGDTVSFIDHVRFFLYNPLTRQRIQLPPYTYRTTTRDVKLVLFSNPSYNPRAVAALKDYKGEVCLCRLGDEKWTSYDTSLFGYSCDIISFKGATYGIDHSPIMTTIDFGENREVCQRPFPLLPRGGNSIMQNSRGDYFLLESQGDLLLVIGSVERYDDDRFHVFKVDFDTRSWVGLTSLGDRMLLLDCACSVSVDATKFTQFGFRPNCIYYTKRGCDDDYYWHEFCVEDGNTVPFGLDFSTICPLPPSS